MRILVGLFFIAFLAASCASDNPVAPENAITRIPGVGSRFTFDSRLLDSNGVTIPGETTTASHVVVSINGSFAGRTGVWFLEEDTHSALRDSLHLCLDTNNDVLMHVRSDNDTAVWIRFPVQSGTMFEYSELDTSSSIKVKFTYTTERIGTETITVAGQAIATVKLTFAIASSGIQDGAEIETRSVTTWWYAPSLGVFVRKQTPAGFIFADESIEELTSFTLR
jgi:hypothetical protein